MVPYLKKSSNVVLNFNQETCMNPLKLFKDLKLITVGTKILFGVALTTNILIGALVFVNLKSSDTIENKVNEVIAIRETLSSNLRETIAELQGEFLALPSFFKSNPQQVIIEKLRERYPVTDSKTYEGRGAYKSFFSRKERRDISKGSVIVQNDQGKILLSYGIIGDDNNFTDNVVRITLQPDNPEKAAATIKQIVTDLKNEESGAGALRKKVLSLNAMVADNGLRAEQTRTEILQHVENISNKEQLLAEIRQQQKDFTLYMGLAAAFANMFILFMLVRYVIERPLSTLTTTIDEIQNGNFPEVPDFKRRDQVGVLAKAIRKFRFALLEIRNETERKTREKKIIDETVHTTTTMIDEIESRAKDLVSLAESLQNLAETTGAQADNVARSAEDTAQNTDQVSNSVVQLEEVVYAVQGQVTSQNSLVADVVEKNRASQIHMGKLGQAVKEIDTIIDLVSDITEQTQLLALNATIEAARAREAGKGFSVVATEMKELSTKTKQAASDVRHKVDAIGRAGDTLTQNFDQIESYLDNLNHATSTIAEGVASQSSAAITISQLAAKTSTNTHDVSSTIQHVNQAAGETSELSRSVLKHAEDIAAQLGALLNETTVKLNQVQAQKQDTEQVEGSSVVRLAEKKRTLSQISQTRQAMAA